MRRGRGGGYLLHDFCALLGHGRSDAAGGVVIPSTILLVLLLFSGVSLYVVTSNLRGKQNVSTGHEAAERRDGRKKKQKNSYDCRNYGFTRQGNVTVVNTCALAEYSVSKTYETSTE